MKKAEVIEHDQPIKALRNKVFSDNIAMNVTLKDEARDRLSVTLRPYISVGKPTHIAGSANILQIGKRKQIMYDAIYDRRGRDVAQSGIHSSTILWLHNQFRSHHGTVFLHSEHQ